MEDSVCNDHRSFLCSMSIDNVSYWIEKVVIYGYHGT